MTPKDPDTRSEQQIPHHRPGENIIVLDATSTAEGYLATIKTIEGIVISREPFPNPEGLYATIRYAGRIPVDKVFIR